MAQLQKNSALKQLTNSLATLARTPGRLTVSLWYRLYGWADESGTPPDSIAHLKSGETPGKQISFTFSVIALSAHVARANGNITQEKYLAFREVFPLSDNMCQKIRELFVLACEDEMPFTHYVNQIKYAYPNHKALFSSLVDRLFCIAAVDGTISPAEEKILAKISHMLELSASEYMEVRDHHMRASHAYHVLGVNRKSSPEDIKKQYRKLMRKYHPDHHASMAHSADIEMVLQLKASDINDAYSLLSKKAA